MPESNVVELELQGWRALSSTGKQARAFYERVLDDRVLMLLPGGVVLDDRTTILQTMSRQPWAAYKLEKAVVLALSPDVAVVAYGVVARRAGAAVYSAQVSSTYVRREDGWKLAVHQQTPR
jgi:hypothetical protein